MIIFSLHNFLSKSKNKHFLLICLLDYTSEISYLKFKYAIFYERFFMGIQSVLEICQFLLVSESSDSDEIYYTREYIQCMFLTSSI